MVVDGADVAHHEAIFLALEHKYVRGAGGAVGARYVLTFVEQVGEGVGFLAGALHHFVERIFGLELRIVGVDGHYGITHRAVFLVEGDDALLVGLRIGAVVAGKHHDEPFGGLIVFERHQRAVDVFEAEVGGPIAGFVLTHSCEADAYKSAEEQEFIHFWEVDLSRFAGVRELLTVFRPVLVRFRSQKVWRGWRRSNIRSPAVSSCWHRGR